MKKAISSAVLAIWVLIGSNSLAYAFSPFHTDTFIAEHGGGLDKNGCHHDRKRGGYHCH